MSSNQQILVLIMSIIICINGHALRKKRQGPDALASFFIDKAAEGMAILEHGAAYKGQQDHQFDFFGAQAGIDAKPKVGFGDAIKDPETSEETRSKRQAQADPSVESAMKMVKQFTDLIHRDEESDTSEETKSKTRSKRQVGADLAIEGAKEIIKQFTDMADCDNSKQPEGQKPEKN